MSVRTRRLPPLAIVHTMSIQLEIPGEWIALVTSDAEIFGSQWCGYWARGVLRNPRGWLVRDVEATQEDNPLDAKAEERDAIIAFRSLAAAPLPPGWYRFDRSFAIKAYEEAVRRYGISWWYDGADADAVDEVIQTALFGKPKYG